MFNCLSDEQPIIMCQCHETLFVMCCCRLLPWRRGSSKVRVYTLSIVLRHTGTVFAFLQCLKLVYLMFEQAVVAPALITLIFWSSSSAAAAAPAGPKTGHAWNSNCLPKCCITLKKIMWTMKSWWVHRLQVLPWSDVHLAWGWPPKWSIQDAFSLRIYECREFVLLISKIMHVSMMIPPPAADAAAEASIEPRGICTTPSSWEPELLQKSAAIKM